MQKNLTIFILMAVVLALLLNKVSSCTKHKEELKTKDNLIAALADTLTKVRHKDSSTTTSIQVIQTDKPKDFLKLQTKDSQITVLKEVVQEYKKKLVEGSSVTQGLIETVAELKSKGTTTIVKTDTIRGKDSIVYIYPTYLDSAALVKDSITWVKVTGLMGRDTTNYKVKVHNEFSAIVGSYKRNPFVDINLKNPYSEVTSLRSYQVSIKPDKRWVVSVGAGYGANTNFKKISDWSNNTFIGIFIGKPIIRF